MSPFSVMDSLALSESVALPGVVGRPTLDGRRSDIEPACIHMFSRCYGLFARGPNFERDDAMIRFEDPATEERPPHAPTHEQHRAEGLTPAQAEAFIRSIDETLLDAQRLRGLPKGRHLRLVE
jgi:hypothetical protein